MDKQYARKIIKFGRYSYAVTIPREVIAEFRWQKGQQIELTVDAKSKKLTVADWKDK